MSKSKSKKVTQLLDPTTSNDLKEDDSLHTSVNKSSTDSKLPSSSKSSASQIKNIWASNLTEAIEAIIEHYPYIAMDTEFPGVVARPRNSFRHWLGYGYRLVADNVNMLKLIQLGLTFYNDKGESPSPH